MVTGWTGAWSTAAASISASSVAVDGRSAGSVAIACWSTPSTSSQASLPRAGWISCIFGRGSVQMRVASRCRQFGSLLRSASTYVRTGLPSASRCHARRSAITSNKITASA